MTGGSRGEGRLPWREEVELRWNAATRTMGKPGIERRVRSKITPTAALLEELADSALLLIDELAASEDVYRWKLTHYSPADRSAVEDQWLVTEVSRRLRERVDRSAATSGPGMPPSKLLESLTATSMELIEHPSIRPSALYGGTTSYLGEPITSFVEQHRRLVLLGEPGSGKSTALQGLVARHLEAGGVAVICSLTDVVRMIRLGNQPDTVQAAMAVVVEAAFASYTVGTSAASAFTAAIQSRSAVIALDALDEVAPRDRDVARTFLETASDTQAQLIVSSRHGGYEKMGSDWFELNVDRLSDEAQLAFLRSYFGDTESDGYQRARAGLKGATSLGETPVLLTIIAAVAEYEVAPTSIGRLYEAYLLRFLRRGWKPAEVRRDRHATRGQFMRTLRRMAWSMIVEDEWVDLSTPAEFFRLLPDSDHAAIQDIIDVDGLLVPHGGSDDPYFQPLRWLHRTLHEHLVGVHLASVIGEDPSRWRERVATLIQKGNEWRVALAHFLGALEADEAKLAIEYLFEFADQGDPGGIIRRGTFEIVAKQEPDSLVRQVAVERYSRDGEWQYLIQLDPNRWAREWPRVREGNAVDVARYFSRSSGVRTSTQVLEAYRRGLLEPGTMFYYLAELDPGTAIQEYARAASQGYREIDTSYDKYASHLTVEQAIAALDVVKDASPYAIYMVLLALSRLHVQIVYSADDPPTGEPYEFVAAVLGEMGHPSIEVPEHIASAVSSGQWGDEIAFLAGQTAITDRTDRTNWCGWARLGRLFRIDILEERNPWLEMSVSGDDASVLEAIGLIETRPNDPESLWKIAEKVQGVLLDEDAAGMSTRQLLHLYKSLYYWYSSCIDRTDTVALFVFELSREFSQDIVRLLRQRMPETLDLLLSEDSLEWVDTRPYDTGWPVNPLKPPANRYIEILRWAGATRRDVTMFFEIDELTDERLSELFDVEFDLADLTPDDLGTVADALYRRGALPLWRPRLLDAIARRTAVEGDSGSIE